VAIVDLESGELTGSVPLGSRPGAVAMGEGSVWIALPDRGAVIQIDTETMGITDTVPVGANPVGIAVSADSVWVANGGNSTVSRISPATNQVVDTIDVPGAPASIAVNDEGVWVADSIGDALTPIDAETGEVLASIHVGDRPIDVAEDGLDLWVANAASGSVSRVHPGTEEVQPIDAGEGPQAVGVGAEGIWVANLLDGTVSRIDPDTTSSDTIRVGGWPTDLAFGGGFVWVTDGSAGSVNRIDPQSGVVTMIPLGSYAGSIASGDGALWVSVRGAASTHRGGTLTVVGALSSLDSIDPAIAHSYLSFDILSLAYDGLVGYRRVGGVDGATLVPNLARSIPVPADGGKTYTFQLRPGIRYSSGESVKPQDFRRAIERVFSLRSDGRSYFDTIIGAADCRTGSCDLSQGIETDDDAGSVTFHLVRPDPDFLSRLAMAFASAVPAETADAPAGTTPLPGTGPYVIERMTIGEEEGEVMLVRNPEFKQWSDARPDGFPDKIVFRLGSYTDANVNEQADDVLEGRADYLYSDLPADRLAALRTTHAGQLHADPFPGTGYMFLNAHVPPFDNASVRRALNYAVDRGALIDQVWGESVRVTCQLLPPTFPGYVPYCPYSLHPDGTWTAPDLAKAEELVERSGTEGFHVVVWATREGLPDSVPTGRYFVDLLNRLGYRARLRVVGLTEYVSAIEDPSQHVQIAYLVWSTDYLAESAFIPPLTCDTTGNDRVCDRTIERGIERATNMQLTDPAASHELWSDLEHDLIDLAPWVPLTSGVWTSLVSQRLGNYQFHPYWAPLFDQMWVR
jgi:YVTN family beta-propeller protein